MKILSGLKLWFIIYFIIKIIVDIYLVVNNKDIFKDLGKYGVTNVPLTAEAMLIIIFAVNALMFLIGLWLFSNLESKKNWARVVLLIIGWLAVLDFLSGLLLSSKSIEALKNLRISVDWEKLILIDNITGLLSFIFWVSLIILLQFNMKVREMFE